MRISDWSSDVCSSDLAKEQADVALDKLTEILSQGGDRDTLDFFVTGSLYSFIDPLFIAIADQGDQQLRGARSEIAESSERIRQIGRTSGRERVCQSVEVLVVAGSIKKKKTSKDDTTEKIT